MPGLFPISIEEQIACVKRELAMRKHVYPRRVSDKKMTQALADKETEHMGVVLETLERIKAGATA